MSIISNIKNAFALTSVLFLFTACGGGGGGASSPVSSTHEGSLATSSGAESITSISRPTTIPESITIPESTTIPGSTIIPESTTIPGSTIIPESTTIPGSTKIPESTPPETSSMPSLKLQIKSVEEIEVTDESAIVKWELNEYAMGQIEYGFDTTYGDFSIKEESFQYSTHIQHLKDLEPNSIYHYRIISEDTDGNRVVSEDRIFKTKNDGTVSLEPALEEEPSTVTPAPADEGTTPALDGATVITGLKAGDTVAAATNNTTVINAALTGGNKNLIIPSGVWYTGHTIRVYQNTTLTFKGKLHQLDAASVWEDYSLLTVAGANVTLNNPHLSQKGRIGKHGTHTCLSIYGSTNLGNTTINGGILEWGASNNFHGGRNNTVFNGTIFRDSMEHLVYAYGIRGDGLANGRASGLTFNDCIFERPGNGLYPEIEANHIQIRDYKNVEMNNCIVKGKKKTTLSQFGILVTNVDGLVVNDTTFEDYTAGLLYTGVQTKGVVFNRVVASGAGNLYIRKNSDSYDATFNDCTFGSPYGIMGDTKFYNSTFKPTRYYMKTVSGATVTFDNSTWDYSNSTYSKAFVKEEGSSVTFTGTQTKIAPLDGHTLDWGLLSTEG